MRPIAERNGRTLVQLAIAGARRPAQIEETVPAGDWTLAAADIDALRAKREQAAE